MTLTAKELALYENLKEWQNCLTTGANAYPIVDGVPDLSNSYRTVVPIVNRFLDFPEAYFDVSVKPRVYLIFWNQEQGLVQGFFENGIIEHTGFKTLAEMKQHVDENYPDYEVEKVNQFPSEGKVFVMPKFINRYRLNLLRYANIVQLYLEFASNSNASAATTKTKILACNLVDDFFAYLTLYRDAQSNLVNSVKMESGYAEKDHQLRAYVKIPVWNNPFPAFETSFPRQDFEWEFVYGTDLMDAYLKAAQQIVRLYNYDGTKKAEDNE